MKLILMRHAEAESSNDSLDDFHRKLSAQGCADVAKMACLLQATGWLVDEVRSSPFIRAQQSQEALIQKLNALGGFSPSFRKETDERLKPGLMARDALNILAEIENKPCSVWIFHAPDIAQVASFLTATPVNSYYFSPGSMLALNLKPLAPAGNAVQIWQSQPEYIRKLSF